MQAAEEKERRKEEKRAAKAQAAAGEVEVDDVEDAQEKGTSTSAVREQVDAVDDDIPVLANRDLPNLRAVLKEADAVIQVLDARDPLRCRSASLDEAVKDKKVLFVLNKIGAPILYVHRSSRSHSVNAQMRALARPCKSGQPP